MTPEECHAFDQAVERWLKELIDQEFKKRKDNNGKKTNNEKPEVFEPHPMQHVIKCG
jgi:hypothetical protein